MTARSRFTNPLLLILTLSILSFAGCKGETRVPVFPVTGKVDSFQGEIPAGANVTLHSVNRAIPDDVAPLGRVNGDGSFQIGTYDVADGAPAGEYVVTVEWFKIVPEGRGPNVLPKKYASAASSPVKISVNGATDIPPIQLAN